MKEEEKLITISELRKHNSPSDAWTLVNDKVLDITKFADRHPGGEIILLAAGKDATVLFHSYHPKGVPKAIVEKLTIGTLQPDASINHSYYDWNSPFYSTLCERVVERLRSMDRPLRGNTDIQIKALMILACFWTCIVQMCLAPNLAIAIGWSIAMGFFAHLVGTCIQHDGNHGSFSTNRYLNTIAGWTLDMIGASAFTWQIQHMLGHHPYTNLLDVHEDEVRANIGTGTGTDKKTDTPMDTKDQESDPDVFSSFPLMRMHPAHQPEWYHKYQHLYAPVLFAFMTLAKVFQQDVEIVTSHRLYHIDANCIYGNIMNKIRFWSMKALSMVYMLVLPCYFHGIRNGIILFAAGHLMCGETLATMFIVNHVIEGVSFAQKDLSKDGKSQFSKIATAQGVTPMEKTRDTATEENKNKVPLNDWAAYQCQTSVNWSPGSWFWNHFSGGLSHQIEHHLFPSICHTNYVHIQDVVEKTCREFGVPYQAEPNLLTAYFKMMKHLKTMGAQKVL